MKLKKIMVSVTFLMVSVTLLANPQWDLIKGVKKMDVELVKTSLQAGANVNALDKYGFGPLHYAAGMNSPEVLQLLLKNGAKVNLKVERLRMNALHIAAMNGMTKNIEILLKTGADQNLVDIDNRRPADYARDAQTAGKCEDCASLLP